MPEIKRIFVEGEKFHYSLSFDIDDFIGDGVWWLQVYDERRRLIHDRPFASSLMAIDEKAIPTVIKNEILYPRGVLR